MATVKQIIDEFCYRTGLPTVSSYVTNTTSTTAQQYVSLLRFVGESLLSKPYAWAVLKRSWMFVTQVNCRNYPMPGDFYRMLESTAWDSFNQWPMRGPISDYNYAIRSLAIVSLQTRKGFRDIGKTDTIFHGRVINEYNSNSDMYFEIDPAGANETNLCQYEYISKNWAIPKKWVYNTAYTTASPDVVSVNGNIYTCTTNGTSTTLGNPPPTVKNGFGQDGNSIWLNVVKSNWASTTTYAAGTYVMTSAFRYYLCTTGGTSSGVEPTSETNPVTDGTVTWENLTVPIWTSQTQYEYGDYVQNSTSHELYLNVSRVSDSSTSISGNYIPAWSYNTSTQVWQQTDGTVVWAHSPAAYSLRADTDLILFDDDIMVDGLSWAYLRMKGLEYTDKRNEWEDSVRSAAGRANGPTRINAADEFGDQFGMWPNTPAGSWDV